jgi:hypothetical protein
MRSTGKPPRPKTPKDIAAELASSRPFDRSKARRESQRAVQAADRLLREMDDVLKHLAPKR